MDQKQVSQKRACPFCGKPIDEPVKRRIVDRGWDHMRHKQFVREREMEFCSEEHATSYQMGCEG